MIYPYELKIAMQTSGKSVVPTPPPLSIYPALIPKAEVVFVCV
jgi:hypothetical protein